MKVSETPRYLLDVNVLVALTATVHEHHPVAREWFNVSPRLPWAICAFTEAGFLRTLTAPRPGQLTMHEATAVLKQLAQHPGYRYQPVTADWHTLCGPLFKRLVGHNQVTDAYLLGLAVREGLILVTFDRAMRHLAGEYTSHVLLLEGQRRRKRQ